jgi:hypothetical protein
MPNLVKQIVDGLMDKFKNEDPEMVFKIIEEMRNNIRQSRIDLLNTDEKQEN